MSLRFLENFKGYLHVDGYAGYRCVPDVTIIDCFAHARRVFKESLSALPKGASAVVITQGGLDFCNQLFMIERKTLDMTPKERYDYRILHSHPMLGAIQHGLNAMLHRQPRKGRSVNFINH